MQQVLTQLLGPAGALVLALAILFGGWKKWWVFGWQYKDVAKEKDEWKHIALKGTNVAERVVSIAEKGQTTDGNP